MLAPAQADHVFLEQPVRQTSTQEAMRFARQLCVAREELATPATR